MKSGVKSACQCHLHNFTASTPYCKRRCANGAHAHGVSQTKVAMPDDWHFSERLDNDRQWPAEGHSSTYAPGQPVPHRPLTHHGGTPPNLIQRPCPCRHDKPSNSCGWAAVFGFMGMGKSLSRCRCMLLASTFYLPQPDPQLPMHSSMQASYG